MRLPFWLLSASCFLDCEALDRQAGCMIPLLCVRFNLDNPLDYHDADNPSDCRALLLMIGVRALPVALLSIVARV